MSLLDRQQRRAAEEAQLATMSRPRFVTFQLVTLTTALFTCLTVLALALMKNTELQKRLLNWGSTADCILNHTDPLLTNEDSAAAESGWTTLFNLVLHLSQQCGLNQTLL